MLFRLMMPDLVRHVVRWRTQIWNQRRYKPLSNAVQQRGLNTFGISNKPPLEVQQDVDETSRLMACLVMSRVRIGVGTCSIQ